MIEHIRLDEVKVGDLAKFPLDDGTRHTPVVEVRPCGPGYVLVTEARTYPACYGEAPVSIYSPGDPMFR